MKIYPKAAIGIAAAALLMMTAGCSTTPATTTSPSGSGAAVTPVTMTLGLVQGQDFIHAMPARVAEAQGFFTKESLNVSIVAFTSGSALTKGMVGGSVDVGAATGLEPVTAAAHGVNLPAFYGVEGASPMALIVPANSTIKTFADLKGKKVGISAFGSLTDYTVRATLAKANIALSDVKEVPLGSPATTMAGMARGDVDAFVLPVNFGYILEAKGTGKIAQTAADALGHNDQFAILMASDTYITSNSAALKRLAKVYTESINWMKANKTATVALAVAKLGMTEAIATKTYDGLISLFTPDGKLNASGMGALAAALPSLGIATTVPKESAYLSTSIISK